MAHWTLDDIPWEQFDGGKLRPELIAVAKAAAMVEYNGYDYARYLCEVFPDDEAFQQVTHQWAEEEVQHGKVLRKWAELADPAFNFDASFAMFTTGYKLPLNVSESVRGSRSGELVARCMVEIGTSSYYTAIADYTEEPVLKAICRKIAADEFRHYKLFYDHMNRYLARENQGKLKRLKIALSRIGESEDDELAYAFFAAQQNGQPGGAYDRKINTNRYFSCVALFYRRPHIERMTSMLFKAVGLKPHTWLNRAATRIAWNAMRLRGWTLRDYSAQALAGSFA